MDTVIGNGERGKFFFGSGFGCVQGLRYLGWLGLDI